jgi:hypothetical protein
MDRIKIMAVLGLANGLVELYVTREPYVAHAEKNVREILASTGWKEVEAGDYTSPSYLMERDAAQELANALWSAGFRPEQSKQSQGAYDAQGQHLADMRAIAFDKLRVAKP